MSDQENVHVNADDQAPPKGATLQLDPRPERHLLRTGGSSSYLDVVVKVALAPSRSQPKRPPVHVALVIDRSGSMSGPKVGTAKRAALAVLDGLSDQDTAAVVVFDDRIDVVQAEAPVTALVKAHVAAELAGIDARGSTALHEGWLVGCQAIAADSAESHGEARSAGVRRCFLLTDGQANVGLAQPEALAQAAAQVREAARVSTSTFGIGTDYNEDLLGPMALAGGGEFYHLRTPQEIATTFVAELEQVLGTLARDAHLEIEAAPGISVELVSAYAWRAGAPGEAGAGRWVATVGDLLGGEERHVVMSLNFPAADAETGEHTVRVRLTWQDEAGSHMTAWQQCTFHYAQSEAAYDAEMRDETVLHYAAQHLSDRAQREAIGAHKRGDLASAQTTARAALSRLAGLGLRAGDTIRKQEVESLSVMQDELAAPAPDSITLKERYYQSQLRARSKSDLRERMRRSGRDVDPPPPTDNSAQGNPKSGTPPAAGS
ncbi:MAG: VWA domain-containing protein [Ktedonobacterales bacterium]